MKKASKLKILVGAGIIGLSSLAYDCASTFAPIRGSDGRGISTDMGEATYEETMDVLGLERIEQVSNLGNGYFTSRGIDTRLRSLAGVYAGTVNVEKTKTGFAAIGNYSQFMDPDAMNRVCKEADVDGNHIIDGKEQRDLSNKIYNKYAKK